MKKTSDDNIEKFSLLEAQVAENIHKTGWHILHLAHAFFKQYNITFQQYNAMRILYFELLGLPSLELARRMTQKTPDITRLINRLVKAGYITRKRLKSDKRVVIAILTQKGRDLVKSLDKPLTEYTQNNLKHLTKSELKDLNRLLQKVRQSDDIPKKEGILEQIPQPQL